MESIDELKAHLTAWLNQELGIAVKDAVDEANKAMMADLDTRFKSVEDAVNAVGNMVGGVSNDVNGVAGSVTGLAQQILAIPTQFAKVVTDAIANLNPFHLP